MYFANLQKKRAFLFHRQCLVFSHRQRDLTNYQITNMKSTKSQIRAAVDNFLYSYNDLTGGTRQEVLQQAPHGINRLTEQAAIVSELAANPNKAAAADAHLMDMVGRVANKLALYSEMYLTPSNIIPFKAA
jgi:hypothetical protein